MVTFGRSMFCTDAEPYYYDYLCGLDADIPRAVADHIRQCGHCRAQIRQLEAAVAESEAQERSPQGDMDVVETLGLHFAHLGEDVTCAKAKSFLPVLLLPSLEIRIPTPITVHVDHCRRCAQDLESIRELELRPEQLARLSRLYAAIQGGDPQTCRRTRARTWAFACASFEGIETESLDHMCVCPRCRRRVYRCREKILAGRQPGDTIAGVGLCGGISMADLFEWVVPYGRTGESHEHAFDGDEALPAHLQACPECIERMQALHRTIYGIAERVDSGVSTVYTTGREAVKSGGQPGSLYRGYPIRVEVAHREPEPVATPLRPVARIRAVLGRAAASPRFRPAMRAGLLAAAVIPLAVLLLVSTRSASGLSVRALDKAVKQVVNVHVKSYGQDLTKPTQEIWVARASGWMIHKNAYQQSLVDIQQHEQRARDFDAGTSQTVSLTQQEVADFEQGINEVVELVRTGIPADRESQALPQEPAADAREGGETYEWTWEGKSYGQLLRLRVVLDPATRLPERAEYFQRMSQEEQWDRLLTEVFEYPSDEAMNLDKERMFGDR